MRAGCPDVDRHLFVTPFSRGSNPSAAHDHRSIRRRTASTLRQSAIGKAGAQSPAWQHFRLVFIAGFDFFDSAADWPGGNTPARSFRFPVQQLHPAHAPTVARDLLNHWSNDLGLLGIRL